MTDATEALAAAREPAAWSVDKITALRTIRKFLRKLDPTMTVAEILEQLEGERG